MRGYRIASLLLGFLILAAVVQAQNAEEDYIYQDSAIMAPDQAGNEPLSDGQLMVVDTSIVRSAFAISADSMFLLKSKNEYAYANYLDSLLHEKLKESKSVEKDTPAAIGWLELLFTSNITVVILWLLAGGFFTWILFKIFFSNGIFRRATMRSNVKVLQETCNEQPSPANMQSLIATAIQAQNYRLATRYLYLDLIHRLTENGAIVFAVDKTNNAYLRELSGKPYKQEVALLTRNYEYIWYGEFLVDKEQFEQLLNRFTQLNTQL